MPLASRTSPLLAVVLSACNSVDPISIAREAPATWAPEDTIYLNGQRYLWTSRWYDTRATNQIALPVGTPVKLVIASDDREHRLYFPQLGLDIVASPERPAEVWVTMQTAGEWRSRCVQECLPEHPEAMTLNLLALSPEAADDWWKYELWGEWEPESRPASHGAELLRTRDCMKCHALDAPGAGPPLRNFWGSIAMASDGRMVRVHGEPGIALIRDSVFAPTAFPLFGYPTPMPSYVGQLDDEQLEAIVALFRCLPDPYRQTCEGLPEALAQGPWQLD